MSGVQFQAAMKRAACQDVSGSEHSLYQLLLGAIVSLLSCFSGISPFPALMQNADRNLSRSNIPGEGKSCHTTTTTTTTTPTAITDTVSM